VVGDSWQSKTEITHTLLSGREMAQIQPPILTLDPKLIDFYAEVLHLCIETIG